MVYANLITSPVPKQEELTNRKVLVKEDSVRLRSSSAIGAVVKSRAPSTRTGILLDLATLQLGMMAQYR